MDYIEDPLSHEPHPTVTGVFPVTSGGLKTCITLMNDFSLFWPFFM